MNRYRGPSNTTSSRATPQTLCQKCLKKDSYECKTTTQERPYTSRPSRTQQLANPKLLPQLTSDVPNDLLRKEGIADAQIAKKEAGRDRAYKADGDALNNTRKRPRSVSSFSSDSISTISTNISRSPSPNSRYDAHTGQSQLLSNIGIDRKRRRNSNTSVSDVSASAVDREVEESSRDKPSPNRRQQPIGERSTDRENCGGRRRHSRSRSITYTSDTPFDDERKDSTLGASKSKRRRHSSRSPVYRGRDRNSDKRRAGRRTRSPSDSRDRGEVIKNRKSMTPSVQRRDDHSWQRNHLDPIQHGSSYIKDNDRYGSSARERHGDSGNDWRQKGARPPRKERSLSPFSKRLALTQAMNMDR